MISHSFSVHFLMTKMLAFFHVPLGHLYIFGEMSIQVLDPFWNGVVCFWFGVNLLVGS